ncbi:hypothetical protein LWC34_43810 [Kibdelosporangium philippinense]|uniref:Uncharacterized protein n=1 Tax=Kibdelosporangium philippinense TaxID=211113 RepID=A0ABS8ZPL3_9PSEU|nr:hypothetical protein [Kibdelosporangium philippinense]MCE7009690.1 hypothetical protein [Kibdelosporangium philippinense]
MRRSDRKPDFDVVIARDSAWLAVSAGNTVHIVDPKTGGTIKTSTFDEAVDVYESWSVGTEFLVDEEALTADYGSWSLDGALPATVSGDQTLRIHRGTDWSCLTELRRDGEIHGCAWLDGTRLVAVGGRGVYWLKYEAGDAD